MTETITRYQAVGRRKESIARVWISPGEGKILVNKRPYEKYFLRETDRIIVIQPLVATNTAAKYNVSARLSGGGLTGQAGALRLGISRALATADPQAKEL